MNIKVFTKFEDSIIKGNWSLLNFIDEIVKENIPEKHFFKLNLNLKEYTWATKYLYAVSGVEVDPYHYQIRLTKDNLENKFNSQSEELKEEYEVESFKEYYMFVIFHELAHMIFSYNHFKKFIYMIDNKEIKLRDQLISNEEKKANEYAKSLLDKYNF